MNKKIIIWTLIVILVVLLVNRFVFIPRALDKQEEKTNVDVQILDNNKEVELMSGTIVVLETTKGNIEIELNEEKAPITVANFLTYVNEKHYDGTIFHRVINGFMIQGGGFVSDGSQKPTHEEIKLESQNGLENKVGTIAMARTMVPDSATSQFFINTVDNDFLNYNPQPGREGYAVFGKVISGMDIVKAIEAVETGNKGGFQDWPTEDVTITKAYVKE